MRLLGITETCDLGSMYLRLIAEGHDVRVTVSEPLAQGTMAGLVPRSADWRKELDWVREAGHDGVILFEAVGFGALQDELRRDGFQVIGGSAFGDRLEDDRGYAQRLLDRHGLKTAPVRQFDRVDDALADLAQRPRRCVFKRNASAADTFVGNFDDGRDIAALLSIQPPEDGEAFLLIDHVAGVEVGIGAYFDGHDFLRPACIDFEHKRFFAGDMGELTGEMGTVASFQGGEPLFEATLAPLAPLLRQAGHVGYINLNTIVNAQGVWPLEFTCRFGYPGFAVLEPLQAIGWGQLFRQMLDRDGAPLPTQSGFSLAVVLTTPPFPWSRKEIDSPVGLPLIAEPGFAEHIHLGEVGLSNDQLVTSGLYGWTAVVTGTGATIAEARAAAYDRATRVRTPNLRYRLDIGERTPLDIERLAAWGWLNPAPLSRTESHIVR